ncbi:unnamed protein product, partial [Didymodactylos carnosus]
MENRCICVIPLSLSKFSIEEPDIALLTPQQTPSFSHIDLVVDDKSKSSKVQQKWPIFILSISLIDLLLMIFALIKNGGLEDIDDYKMLGVSNVTLIKIGAKFLPCMKNVSHVDENKSLCGSYATIYQYYRFITSIFLHVGIMHLLFNLTAQICDGMVLERKFGTARVGVIYILSGLGGNIVSSVKAILWHDKIVVTVGASGACFGLIGVLLLDKIQNF